MKLVSSIGLFCALMMMVSDQSALAQGSIRELIQGYIKPGDQFPALVLPDLQTGEPRSITEFRGRKVLMHVFASW